MSLGEVEPGFYLLVDGRPSYIPTVVEEPDMADVIFVALTIAVFAVLALVVKGVERLER